MRSAAVLLALLLATGCRSFNKLSNQNLAANYDYRETFLHPEFTIYHENDSLTALYIRIPNDELLYKKNETGRQAASVTVALSLFESFEMRLPFDSLSLPLSNKSPGTDYFTDRVEFRTARTQFIVEVVVTDLFRKKGYTDYLYADKRTSQAAQRFLLIPEDQKAPLFRNYVTGDEKFRFYLPGNRSLPMFVRCYFRDFPVAPPPFAERYPAQFNYRADSAFRMEIDGNTVVSLPRSGIYHFQLDTTVKTGVTVFRFEADFPKITDAGQLVESLRYITTNKEYQRLVHANEPRQAIDEFWVELAGNQDRARTLIRKYYTRIQEANRLFTSYLEGWKTDRGLIFTVMGPPTSVFRTSDTEEWTYGNYNDATSVSFPFEKIYNPFCTNDYILRRSGFYEQIWYRMVDRWRQGVVVND